MAALREESLEAERLFTPELEEKLWSLAGKWVVVSRDELIAVGSTATEATHAAQKARPSTEGLILYRVPEDEGSLNFF